MRPASRQGQQYRLYQHGGDLENQKRYVNLNQYKNDNFVFYILRVLS